MNSMEKGRRYLTITVDVTEVSEKEESSLLARFSDACREHDLHITGIAYETAADDEMSGEEDEG